MMFVLHKISELNKKLNERGKVDDLECKMGEFWLFNKFDKVDWTN